MAGQDLRAPRRDDGDPAPASPRDRVQRLLDWLDATPTEFVGLSVLLAGAVAITALGFLQAQRLPDELPPAAAITGPGGGVTLDGAVAGVAGTRREAPAPERDDPADPRSTITVHVSGAVATPGLVLLEEGARVAEALEAADGPASGAQLERLNLARIVSDGEQVHVPWPGEPDILGRGGSGGDDLGPGGRIDVNRADQEQLESLPGIGPAKAEAIIAHRAAEGPFSVPGDLRAVPGIGEQTFQRLAELVAVG